MLWVGFEPTKKRGKYFFYTRVSAKNEFFYFEFFITMLYFSCFFNFSFEINENKIFIIYFY